MTYQIADLPLLSGTLGIGPMPGRHGTFEADLAALIAWAPDVVLTMNPSAELAHADATGMGDDFEAIGVTWHHLPVEDMGAPPPATEAKWEAASAESLAALGGGGRVFAHCWGGCGRSGMALLRLMVEAGEPPRAALGRLRQARPCVVETEDQFEWASLGI